MMAAPAPSRQVAGFGKAKKRPAEAGPESWESETCKEVIPASPSPREKSKNKNMIEDHNFFCK